MEKYNGLYTIFIKRLKEINYKAEIIPFPYIFEKLCRNFSIKKDECWEVLRFLKEQGIIEINFPNGVKINPSKKICISETIIF
jgi:hypothetical protein